MEEQNINHEKWMREAIYVSINAIQNGNHPFGAIFVDPKQQKVIASAENTVATEKVEFFLKFLIFSKSFSKKGLYWSCRN